MLPSGSGRRVGKALVVLALALAIVVLLLPRGPRDPMNADEPHGRSREPVRATRAIVIAGTPEAARAMRDVLDGGGNAVDAAVAGLLALNVTFGDAASFPGIAPVLVWDAATGEAQSYVGAGTAPARATIEEFRERGQDEYVDAASIEAQLIPASPDMVVALLRVGIISRLFANLPCMGLMSNPE